MKTKLRYVQVFKDRYGKVRTYYRRNGRRQRIDGEPESAEWLSAYMRIEKSFEAAPTKVADHETLGFAIQDYISTSRYQALSVNTRANYRSVLDEIAEVLGAQPIAAFSRGDIIKIRDKVARRSPTRAVLTVNVLRQVFERACDIDAIERNPARGVRLPEGFKSTPHRKWTDQEITLFKERARPHVRRAMMVLLHTGLRCSDALQLKRNVMHGDTIDLTTAKTDTPVVIPIHPDLKQEFVRRLPVESTFMICGARGQSLGRHGLLAMFRREFDRLGVPLDRLPTTHGLRKNAVVAMVEIGAPEQTINAITGQSIPTIRHYAQEYERKKVALRVVPLWQGEK